MGRGAELANGKLAVSQFPLPTGLAGLAQTPVPVHTHVQRSRLHSCLGARTFHGMRVLCLLATKRSGVLPIPSPPAPVGAEPTFQKTLWEGELNHREEVQV